MNPIEEIVLKVQLLDERMARYKAEFQLMQMERDGLATKWKLLQEKEEAEKKAKEAAEKKKEEGPPGNEPVPQVQESANGKGLLAGQGG